MARVFDLLIVDDDPGQLKLIEILLGELGLPHQCHYASGGWQALDFLRRVPPFTEVTRPDLILLDLNMPDLDGCEVLRRIKSDPALCSIPVIMLSSSQLSSDIETCYREHANAYLEKPTGLAENLALLRDIDRFWAQRAVMPGETKKSGGECD